MFLNIIIIYSELVSRVEVFVELFIDFNSRNLSCKKDDDSHHSPEKRFTIVDYPIAESIDPSIVRRGNSLHTQGQYGYHCWKEKHGKDIGRHYTHRNDVSQVAERG